MRLSRFERFKRNLKNNFLSSFNFAVLWQVVLTCLLVAFVVFLVVGYFTQHETITVSITGKHVENTSTTTCESATQTYGGLQTDCTTVESQSFFVYTVDEAFSISELNYYQIVTGRKYVFYVIGWKGFRWITQILEVGK